MMKAIVTCVISAFVICTTVKAQDTKDTSLHKAAVAICGCLTKADIDKAKTPADLQQIFLKCMMDSASNVLGDAMTSGTQEAGEELGKKIALEMMNSGCPAFLKLSMKLAGNSSADDQADVTELKSTAGVVVKVEEKDFLYLTIKNSAGKLVTLIFMADVDGSSDWMKEPTLKLLNKKVNVQWEEEEVYQPKLKDFVNIKKLKALTLTK